MRPLMGQMLAVLERAQERRSEVADLSWIEYERAAMHAAVNAERTRRGLPAVTMDAIARVESNACGHVDYSRKFALYCAELAEGATPPC